MDKKVNIKILVGDAGVGKDTYADKYLKGYKRYAYADHLKEIAEMALWDGEKDIPGRTFLQDLGEVVNRYCVAKKHDPFWTYYVINSILRETEYHNLKNVVITDARHNHEVTEVKKQFKDVANIEVIKLTRDFDSSLTSDQQKHISEQGIDNSLIDKVINLNIPDIAEIGLENLQDGSRVRFSSNEYDISINEDKSIKFSCINKE